jgi:pimeloyl-ACP methyl ester carboxylesterase
MTRHSRAIVRLYIYFMALVFMGISTVATAQPVAQIIVLEAGGAPTLQISDGNRIRLRVELSEAAEQDTQVTFSLDEPLQVVAICTVPQGEQTCETEPFATLGWSWSRGSGTGSHTVQASIEDGQNLAETKLQVAARPVVMVHGFSSTWEAWQNYLGPDGFLASIGVPGFAVGDGQGTGTLNTGDITNPTDRTHTIAENAAILGEYIDNVKLATGAEQVDLLAHSMGGMISRYYIDRVMGERDIVQLLMLGSPAEGTGCANLPASLGFYLPATLEIRPGYAQDIFNRQITHRRGVPFYALAGTPISNPVGSPCTDVPSDAVISRHSVSAVPLNLSEIPLLHTELNTSPQAFTEFVTPLLQKGPGEYQDEPDPQLPGTATASLQFSQIFSGKVAPGESVELTIPIDSGVTVASFALYDPSLSLEVVVRGASGNVIDLDPDRNGVVIVSDPRSLLQLGYGFANPNPGAWRVTLTAGMDAPPSGADYALAARFVGGATLRTSTSSLLPALGESVQFSAALELFGALLPVQDAVAYIRLPDGGLETLPLLAQDGRYQASWEPPVPGLYGIDIHMAGLSPEGSPVERTAFLAMEVQPRPERLRPLAWLASIGLGGLGILFLAAVALVRVVKRRRKQEWARFGGGLKNRL